MYKIQNCVWSTTISYPDQTYTKDIKDIPYIKLFTRNDILANSTILSCI